ncbi:MAG: erythromycin esterase family protein [Deltaproteobacteria bacterium]|nr:erythromycin esterase family protein [Deltaproteobacteria bacterium]
MAANPLDGAAWRRFLDDIDRSTRPLASTTAPRLIRERCEPFGSIGDADVGSLLDRVGDSRVVLLGEATHGTSEFYRMRAHITKALIERKGFSVVAVEGDWPDAALVDGWARHDRPPAGRLPFGRFPPWMWRNREVLAFVEWLHEHNGGVDVDDRVGFYGLDLYSLSASMDAVIGHLDRVDPTAARRARERYGCLSPWQETLGEYGHAAALGAVGSCEEEIVATLRDLLEQRAAFRDDDDDDAFFDAVMNARVVANAEAYYRAMVGGREDSWNLRDTHMVETLDAIVTLLRPGAKAVVWAHNSHVGDATQTEMGRRGEVNVGQLCRERFAGAVWNVGFGTDHGTVAAASHWGGPEELKRVLPARGDSYEHLCHEAGVPAFLLHLRGAAADVVDELTAQRLERAIGVIYRPETERFSHYFSACLPRQFDSWVWFDETRAVHPLEVPGALLGARPAHVELPDTFPSGL